MAKEKKATPVMELKNPVVYESGAIIKTLYINGIPSAFKFNCDNKMRGSLSWDEATDLFYATKDFRCCDFPTNALFDLDTPPEIRNKLIFGHLSAIYFTRYTSAFEIGLDVYFPFKVARASAVNPLRLISTAIANAKSVGFARTLYYGKKVKEDWPDMYSAIFYYRSRCNEQTAMQKTEEAIIVLNELLHKAAMEQYLHLKQSLKV